MSKHRIMTPAEAYRNKLASLDAEINAARERLNEAIQKNGGESFTLDAGLIPDYALHQIYSELHDAGWSMRLEYVHDEGFYYDVRPCVRAP